MAYKRHTNTDKNTTTQYHIQNKILQYKTQRIARPTFATPWMRNASYGHDRCSVHGHVLRRHPCRIFNSLSII